jgi:hypothetical protein
MGTPMAEVTHWIDVGSKVTAKHEILMQHLTQISRDNPLTQGESEAVRGMLGRETYARVPLPWDAPALAQDPLDALREAFPAEPRVLTYAWE